MLLLLSCETLDRVSPLHSYKYIAEVQHYVLTAIPLAVIRFLLRVCGSPSICVTAK
jgi:hypothetical protein